MLCILFFAILVWKIYYCQIGKVKFPRRVKNAIKNHVPVDPTVDIGKWLNISNMNVPQNEKINYANIWQPFPSDKEPKNFTYGSIHHYLVISFINDNNDDSNIENHGNNNEYPKADYSTAEQLKPGKLHVESGHVFEILEDIISDEMFCMKCKIQASYKAIEFHQVSVIINPSTVRVIHGTCDRKASSMGRCSHVAALLYVLLDYLDDCNGDNVPCTSKLCNWNQGRKRKQLYKADDLQYKNKNDMSVRKPYEPGQSLRRPIDKSKINNLLSDLQSINVDRRASSMWQLLLQPQYKDFELEKQRKRHLKTLIYRLTTNVCNNRTGPVDITLGAQSNNDEWWQCRKILITAF